MTKYIFLFFVLFVFSNCVKEDDFQVPMSDCQEKWQPNINLKQVLLINNTTVPKLIIKDSIFTAYVVSSDEAGNFFKTLSLQDDPINPLSGVQIELDKTNLYLDYPVGSKVLINLKGLYIGKDRGVIKIGDKYMSNGEERIGRINSANINSHIQRTCDNLFEIKPLEFQDFSQINNDKYLNQLVSVATVQIADRDVGTTYATTFPEAISENRLLVDRELSNLILRNSGFSDFAGIKMPEGSGSIVGILSKYNNDYQLIIRSTTDVNFKGPRYIPPDEDPPIGGNNITYFSVLNETFDNYSVGIEEFSKYINDPVSGTKYWKTASFSNNKYLQFSSFSTSSYSKEAKNRVLFFIPIDFTTASKFSFKTNDGYNTGKVLKVYYSLNYVPKSSIETASLVDITAEFNIAAGHSSGYGTTFINSGVYEIPTSIIGNGFIIFEYIGGYSYLPPITTTMQLDDIKIE